MEAGDAQSGVSGHDDKGIVGDGDAGWLFLTEIYFRATGGIESMSGHVMANADGAAMSMPFEDATADGVGVRYHPNV